MIDELTITANGQSIKGWQQIAVTRSIEGFPSSFECGFVEKYSGDDVVVVTPGTPCVVTIGSDKVITGYIDMYQSSISPDTHDVRTSGRSKCEDLSDCSAYFGEYGEGSTVINGQTLQQIATELCKPFAIQVISKVDDSPPILQLVINLGETPYEIIEKCARWAGVLVHDDVDGNLVLDRVGSQSMGSGFAQGVNVEHATVSYRTDQRFSDYYVCWQCTNNQNDKLQAVGGTDTANRHGYAEDPGLKKLNRYRPHYIVSQVVDVDLGIDLGQRIADWEANRRFGRSQAVQLVTNSWRDKNGKLWEPNAFATIDLPIIKAADLNWVIGTVVYRRDLQNGTTAELTLYPKQAFDIEPLALSPGDADRVTQIRQAQQDEADKASHRVSVENEGMDTAQPTPPTDTEVPVS